MNKLIKGFTFLTIAIIVYTVFVNVLGGGALEDRVERTLREQGSPIANIERAFELDITNEAEVRAFVGDAYDY